MAGTKHRVSDSDDRNRRFRDAVLPHLDAASNLARWLTGNRADADDAVQDAYVRAQRYFDSCRGDARAWLLAIVRNVSFDIIKERGEKQSNDFANDHEPDETHHATDSGPEQSLSGKQEAERINSALRALPVEYREVLVLREIEGYSYREIAHIAGIRIGTVMSRLSRARRQLIELYGNAREERKRGLL